MKKNRFNKNSEFVLVVLLIIFIAVPLIIQMHWTPFYQFAKLLTPGDKSNWLQFWGSYLGVLPSGLIAALVAGYQIKSANKQSDKARQQELTIMKNSKLVDYCYEMKSFVSRSIVILDTIIKLETSVSLDDILMLSNRYKYFMSKDDANIFEDNNFTSLKKANNNIYFITNILSNLMGPEMLDEQNRYTKNVIFLERFLNSYKQHMENNKFTMDDIQECPNLTEMDKQLNNISKMIDKTIAELGA